MWRPVFTAAYFCTWSEEQDKGHLCSRARKMIIKIRMILSSKS